MSIETVGVIGAGQMGGGIAQVFAAAGTPVHLYDSDADVLYGIDAATDSLITIDTTTGAGTAVSVLTFGGVEGLAWEPKGKTLYGTDANSRELIEIDTGTGIATSIGSTVWSVQGLAPRFQ